MTDSPAPGTPDDVIAALDKAAAAIDMTAGYRARCMAAGFTAVSAEAMAVDFHRSLIAKVYGTPTGTAAA